MRFDVYCDESHPDLLSSKDPQAQYLVIGSLWLPAECRQTFKEEIHTLRAEFRIGGEFKWQKVSPSKLSFYEALVDWFFLKENQLRFRCIAVEHQKVNLLKYHDNDQELGFYKFYYQLLHHWIFDFNEYAIFCDFKKNRSQDRLEILQRCLDQSNLSSGIKTVQAIPSHESVLLQLADLLTGIASARLNNVLSEDGAKSKVVSRLEELIGRRIQHTFRNEQKFNVFVIDLQGGW
jgi:hypothetical protein